MEDLEKQKGGDEVLGPLKISRLELERLLSKAYNITKEPRDYYPTVESIDDLIESEPFQTSVWVREDTFKLFIMCLVWGFSRDEAWHRANPEFQRATPKNLYAYITTPYEGEDAYSCHVGVWDEGASDELKEDRQAAFEYMQSLIMDESMYIIVEENTKKKANCA